MKNIIKIFRITILTGLVVSLCTCKKDKFLNVNGNPNFPSTITVNLALPTIEANTGYMLDNTMGVFGGLYSQYWTQDPTYGSQYGAFDQYHMVSGDVDNLWITLYTNLSTVNYIINNSDTTQRNYAAIAYLMKAYNFQLLDDAFGDIPLSQALQPLKYPDPVFDKQSGTSHNVYDSAVVWIQTALNLIQASSNPTSPPEDLFYPNQSMSQWQKFANTLLLKIYIRECIADPVTAKAGIAKMPSTASSYLMTGSTDDAKLLYASQVFQQYPLYAAQVYFNTRNITGSATVINYFNTLNDPRVADFYLPTANSVTAGTPAYAGELQGDWKALSAQPDNGFSPPGPEVLSATASCRFLTASESYFLQAEAVARGYMSGSAATLYESGITQSWMAWTNSSTNIANLPAYMAQDSVNFAKATTLPLQIRYIITQKWLSMCGNQNFEAWTEWRRTRYPQVFTVSLSSVLGGTLMPLRMVYPTSEINDNTNFPGSLPISTAVWWDKN